MTLHSDTGKENTVYLGLKDVFDKSNKQMYFLREMPSVTAKKLKEATTQLCYSDDCKLPLQIASEFVVCHSGQFIELFVSNGVE